MLDAGIPDRMLAGRQEWESFVGEKREGWSVARLKAAALRKPKTGSPKRLI